jgi:cytochrome c-type biogenesis protein
MSPQEIVTAFTIGLLATSSPCVLPLYPGFLAFLSTQTNTGRLNKLWLLGFLVLAGVMSMMLVLGGIISMLSISLGSTLSILIPLADLILIGFGLLLLLGVNPFKHMPQWTVPAMKNPYTAAYLYGLLYGPLTLPCSGPLIISIFAVSLTSGEVLSRLGTFFWFGLGFGVPLLVLSFLGAAAQRWITRTTAVNNRWISALAGLLLIGIGIYDGILNWDLILSFAIW